MISGVLQRLEIVRRAKGYLTLRELPLLEWLIVASLFIASINMAVFNLTLTAVGMLLVGIVIGLMSRMRYIIFDAQADQMSVVYRNLLRQRVVQSMLTEEIVRAYLSQNDDGATQIILVTTQGEMGLSVYSRDLRPWKEEVVIAINEFLYDTRQLQAEREAADGLGETPTN